MSASSKLEEAYFAGGCFWCTEAIFKRLRGVVSVEPGYSGGRMENPSYEQVSSGVSGHAESIKIIFDPKVISYKKLLEVFLKTHDPTQLNRQENDVGTQYRSAIFYASERQKRLAQDASKRMQQEFEDKIVTEIVPFSSFYPGEEYHRNYYDNNKNAVYCKLVIDPKIQKLYIDFGDIVKK